MIGSLYVESREIQSDLSDDPILAVFHQLPYFCCPDTILDRKIQEDISRYVYCEDTKTQPYPGDYGDVPAKWLSIHFILRNAINLSHNEYRKEYQNKMKAKEKTKKII